jgi:hypothetical protein
VALCLFATALSGCHDASSDPLAVILTEQTRSVLAAEARLPSLPELVREAGIAEQHGPAAESWSGSWDLDVREGRDLRVRASADVVGPVARALGPARVGEAVQAVGETLTAAAALETSLLADDIAENLAAAKLQHERAVTALAGGRDVEALEAALAASDLIREVGPESVTRLLLARAEAKLATLGEEKKEPMAVAVAEQLLSRGEDAPETEDPEQLDLERARRLVKGAQQALEAGDYVLAIQRAFYACQVLGVDAG